MTSPPRRISAELRETVAVAEGKCPACGADRPDASAPCPNCGAPPLGPAEPARPPTGEVPRRDDARMQVRASDMEPYIGLRYLSKLFRLMAIVLILLLLAEVITGFYTQGKAAIPTLLAEGSRLIVLAGLLWGVGDLAILLIDVGHDVRATRILLGRQAVHQLMQGRETSATPPGSSARMGDASAGSGGARHPEGSG
ncbi:MAG TPA: zinc ribbon domain-containing protein [Gemmatimonadaceae bacterium]|nr:zinc ribbon domain-containing protein [Gemmatimonadaceae bacterium]